MEASPDLALLARHSPSPPDNGAATPEVAAHGASTAASAVRITEFLAFKLGSEEYGIDILRVQEIRSYEPPTRIANTPPHLLGVLNLRGLIVPIVDLRLQFALQPAAYDNFTVTIVLGLGSRVVGIVVDAVSDVITLSPEQLRPVPALHSSIDSEHLLAIGAVDDRMLILMDIEKLMTSPAMALVDTPTH